ncbi:HAD family hydrolase [Saccharothrix deserti]|uniref:HAD family hydrolase n=1 Tax=Saccharothrix deserti TaxID=2593674 RepID=UPI00131CE608|nr:HAD family phosphatase [Saccharothrix deserti]
MTARATPPADRCLPPLTQRPRGVVFDLDGTLVDSWHLHLACLRDAAAAVGGRPPSAARLLTAQRPTDAGTVRALVGADHLEPALRAYQEAFAARIAERPAVAVPGAVALVHTLRERQVPLAVCTGRGRQEALLLLAAAGLPRLPLVAREDCTEPKPAPEGLLLAIHAVGLQVRQSLYVGDSPADVAQGEAAGVATVLLPPGHLEACFGPWLLSNEWELPT